MRVRISRDGNRPFRAIVSIDFAIVTAYFAVVATPFAGT
jgi:hypothetical protein